MKIRSKEETEKNTRKNIVPDGKEKVEKRVIRWDCMGVWYGIKNM